MSSAKFISWCKHNPLAMEGEQLNLNQYRKCQLSKSIYPDRSKTLRYSSLFHSLCAPFVNEQRCLGFFENNTNEKTQVRAAVGFFVPQIKEKLLCITKGRELYLFSLSDRYLCKLFFQPIDSFVVELKGYPVGHNSRDRHSTSGIVHDDSLLLMTSKGRLIILHWNSFKKRFTEYFNYNFTLFNSTDLYSLSKQSFLFDQDPFENFTSLNSKPTGKSTCRVMSPIKADEMSKGESLYCDIDRHTGALAVAIQCHIICILFLRRADFHGSPCFETSSGCKAPQEKYSIERCRTVSKENISWSFSLMEDCVFRVIYPGSLVSFCWLTELKESEDNLNCVSSVNFGILCTHPNHVEGPKLLSLYCIPYSLRLCQTSTSSLLFPSVQLELPNTSKCLTYVPKTPEYLIILGDFGLYIFYWGNKKIVFCYSLIVQWDVVEEGLLWSFYNSLTPEDGICKKKGVPCKKKKKEAFRMSYVRVWQNKKNDFYPQHHSPRDDASKVLFYPPIICSDFELLFCSNVEEKVLWKKFLQGLWLPPTLTSESDVPCLLVIVEGEKKEQKNHFILSFPLDSRAKTKPNNMCFLKNVEQTEKCFIPGHLFVKNYSTCMFVWKSSQKSSLILLIAPSTNAIYMLKFQAHDGTNQDSLDSFLLDLLHPSPVVFTKEAYSPSILSLQKDTFGSSHFNSLCNNVPQDSPAFITESITAVPQQDTYVSPIVKLWIFPRGVWAKEECEHSLFLCCVATFNRLTLLLHTRESWTVPSSNRVIKTIAIQGLFLYSVFLYPFESSTFFFGITHEHLIVSTLNSKDDDASHLLIYDMVPSSSKKSVVATAKFNSHWLLLVLQSGEVFLLELKKICLALRDGVHRLKPFTRLCIPHYSPSAPCTLSLRSFAIASRTSDVWYWTEGKKGLSRFNIEKIHLSYITLAHDDSTLFCGSLCGQLIAYNMAKSDEVIRLWDRVIEKNQMIRYIMVWQTSGYFFHDPIWTVFIQTLHCFVVTVRDGTALNRVSLVSGLNDISLSSFTTWELGSEGYAVQCFGLVTKDRHFVHFGFIRSEGRVCAKEIHQQGDHLPVSKWKVYERCPSNPHLMLILSHDGKELSKTKILLAYDCLAHFGDWSYSHKTPHKGQVKYIFHRYLFPQMPSSTDMTTKGMEKGETPRDSNNYSTKPCSLLSLNSPLLVWESQVDDTINDHNAQHRSRESFFCVALSYTPAMDPTHHVLYDSQSILMFFSYNTSLDKCKVSRFLEGTIVEELQEILERENYRTEGFPFFAEKTELHSGWCKPGVTVQCLTYWKSKDSPHYFVFVRHPQCTLLNGWVPLSMIRLNPRTDNDDISLSSEHQRLRRISKLPNASQFFFTQKLNLDIPFGVTAMSMSPDTRYLALGGGFNLVVLSLRSKVKGKETTGFSSAPKSTEYVELVSQTQLSCPVSKIQWVKESTPCLREVQDFYFLSVFFSFSGTQIFLFNAAEQVLKCLSTGCLTMMSNGGGWPTTSLSMTIRGIIQCDENNRSFCCLASSHNTCTVLIDDGHKTIRNTRRPMEEITLRKVDNHGVFFRLLHFKFQLFNKSTQDCLTFLLDVQNLLLGLSIQVNSLPLSGLVMDVYKMAKEKTCWTKALWTPKAMLLYLFYIYFRDTTEVTCVEHLKRLHHTPHQTLHHQASERYVVPQHSCAQATSRRDRTASASAMSRLGLDDVFLKHLAYAWLADDERKRALVSVLRVVTVCNGQQWNSLREDIFVTKSSYWESETMCDTTHKTKTLGGSLKQPRRSERPSKFFQFFGYKIPQIAMQPWKFLDFHLLKCLQDLSPTSMHELDTLMDLTRLGKRHDTEGIVYKARDIGLMAQDILFWSR